MTTTIFESGGRGSTRSSATIHQFPIGGRAGIEALRDQAQGNAKAKAEMMTPRISVGSGWYHDAAIQEDKWTGEH